MSGKQSTTGRVDRRGADLRGVNMSGINLEEADLRQANLGGAYLSGAMLDPFRRPPSPSEIAAACRDDRGSERGARARTSCLSAYPIIHVGG